MSPVWIAVLVLAAPPASTTSPGESAVVSPSESEAAPAPDGRSALRRAQDLRSEVSDRLRREATTEGSENQEAIHDLIELFATLTNDRDLTKDERKRLRGKVRSRLQRVAKRIERENALAEKQAQRGEAPAKVTPPVGFAEVLGQQLNNFGQAVGQGGGAETGEALIELIKTTTRPGSWDDVGGPGSIMLYKVGAAREQFRQIAAQAANGARGFFGGGQDEGEELVELIQAVIAPNSWDVNGGPGAIYYYRPLRVLVIRQTSEVHGDVGDVFGQLRRAGN